MVTNHSPLPSSEPELEAQALIVINEMLTSRVGHGPAEMRD